MLSFNFLFSKMSKNTELRKKQQQLYVNLRSVFEHSFMFSFRMLLVADNLKVISDWLKRQTWFIDSLNRKIWSVNGIGFGSFKP